jgi:hypothetical protein
MRVPLQRQPHDRRPAQTKFGGRKKFERIQCSWFQNTGHVTDTEVRRFKALAHFSSASEPRWRNTDAAPAPLPVFFRVRPLIFADSPRKKRGSSVLFRDVQILSQSVPQD